MAARQLVLNFDVNKTLIMTDIAGGKALGDMLNSVISESVWGRVNREPAPPTWECINEPISYTQPEAEGELVTYSEFVEDVLHLPKKERKAAKVNFTEEGKPGAAYADDLQKLLAALQLPLEGYEDVVAAHPQLFGRGEYFLLPSFFNLLLHLQATARDYRLVFRTFGTDIVEVAECLNLFATGKHPGFPGVRMDGSKPPTPPAAAPAAVAGGPPTQAWGEVEADTAAADDAGSGESKEQASSGGDSLISSGDRRLYLPHASGRFTRGTDGAKLALVSESQLVSVFSGYKEIAEAQASHLRRYLTLGIQDDFHWWHAQGEVASAGKLLVVDEAATLQEGGSHPVFFDDNVGRFDAHIVDVRELQSQQTMPMEHALDKYLVRVDPLSAILDPNYYINAVAKCEQNLAAATAKAGAAAAAEGAE